MLLGQHSVEGIGSSSLPSHRLGTRGSKGVSATDTPMVKTDGFRFVLYLPCRCLPSRVCLCRETHGLNGPGVSGFLREDRAGILVGPNISFLCLIEGLEDVG